MQVTPENIVKHGMEDRVSDVLAGTEDEERSEREFSIAEQIALLSQATEAPTEFEPTGRAVRPNRDRLRIARLDVVPRRSAGMASVAGSLTLKDQDRFLETLAVGLGFDEVNSAVESAGDGFRLNTAGLDRLSDRLQRALQIQEQFRVDLESDGGSLASATGKWLEAWEELDAEEEEGSGPVSARAKTWSINEFSDRAIRGKLNLSPSYQRETYGNKRGSDAD